MVQSYRHNEQKLSRVAVTIGDPAGIGPEIVVKAIHDLANAGDGWPLVIGDLRYLRSTARCIGIDLEFERDGDANSGEVPVVDLANLPEAIEIGVDAGPTGRASAEYIESAIKLWRAGRINALATAPISKKAIALGGYQYPGHTEFLAELTSAPRVAMTFFAGNLRVVLLSTHLPLKAAINLVNKENLVDLVLFADRELSRLLKMRPRIAMAGLNPHASEGGMFGNEEIEQIIPAIAECRERHSVDISGPYSPDTIFLRAYRGEFDAVIACYHDQATIPVKAISFGSSVNVTLGLPLIRTSVDHGTAFDIAGKGIADASSMVAAIRLAGELASV